jgi:FkbM family methyltransferase
MKHKMKLYGRDIDFRIIPNALIWVFRLFITVRDPFEVLLHYVRRTSPSEVNLKNGYTLGLGGHPHDLITFFVIFIKKDYGEIEKSSTIIDVGANIGMFSLYAAIRGASRVYAYEPNPQAFSTFRENVIRNDLCGVINSYNLAVTDSADKSIYISVDASPYNQTKLKDEFSGGDQRDFVEVASTTVDEIVETHKLKEVSLLKMDCEGAEYDIFPSISISSLEKIKSIRMEVHGDKDALVRSLKSAVYVEDKWDTRNLWLTQAR